MSLEEMQEQVERYYINMENELLLNIAKKLADNKPMEIDKWDAKNNRPLYGSGGVNEWQLERLKELGGLNEENARIIAEYSEKTVQEVERIFYKARQIGTEVDKEILELGIKAGILNEINPISEEYRIKNILDASIREVLTTFNEQNNSLLTSAGNNYRKIVNKVSSQVMSGTKTTGKAMQEAVSELAQKGLTGFTAKNGAQWSPEAYTKMVIRTNTQNTINRVQEERMTLAGNDYIEISSHLGARPLCSQDQGHIFSLSGNTTPIQDGNGREITPRAWSSSTYGEPAGILGINCGHSRYAFVPSLSIKRDKDFTKEENDEAYIEKQQQRQYERAIRNKKREITMLKQTGAEQEYIRSKTKQLSNYRKEYTDFLDKTGRTRITANEWLESNKKTKGLASSNKITIENHNPPKLLQELAKVDDKNTNKVINKYEKIIKDDKIENAIVITRSGKVYQCFGNATNVWPDVDLGDELLGAIVTHNHPKEETNYGFSQADINLFEKYNLKRLRGIDEKYFYEFDRSKKCNTKKITISDDIEDITYEHIKSVDYSVDNNILYRRELWTEFGNK